VTAGTTRASTAKTPRRTSTRSRTTRGRRGSTTGATPSGGGGNA
jgi:hypothetical protein